ncbi:hypothetical protein K431DRAFT_253950 [Polychaeton citri CBS 116435]|uniref:Bacterial surface antigen (D15) domain-containing protein n=1 Tax=Polychaeton citri CBS 116435 TaxID=1314669 RepID=A0A9P4Q087_9PEZI|nr:hypothetical protein K431DRAFT_253950 [Polychaeton citri CBS 116435]
MASSPLGDDILSQLRNPINVKEIEQREKEVAARIEAQYAKSQQRQLELIQANANKPVTLSSVRLVGAPNTRASFLSRIFDPLLSQNRTTDTNPAGTYSLREALQQVGVVAEKLNRLDIFQQPISSYIDTPDQSDPSTTPTDHVVFITAKERGKYTIKTGTEAGSSEGSAFVNVALRNIFGGAENVNANASLGTRTRSAYSANFDTPILANPDLRFDIGGVASSTIKSWASHEEVLKGGNTRLQYFTSPFTKHEVAYTGLWRQVTGLSEKASPTIRQDAGDSFKSALSHTWLHDSRDVPMMPSRGVFLKTLSEVAGSGPLRGDVAHAKFEVESQGAVPIPIPGIEGDRGVSLTAGIRGGLLYPLTAQDQSAPSQSRINDRFQLGGPTDVRGFRLSGLGPRDGQDAVGGDVYAAGGASLLLPLPRLGKETPLRFQAFVNAGRLLALKDVRQDKEQPMTSSEVKNSVSRTVNELTNGLPSCAAGVGLVYAHPAARFELNFSLPLVLRKGEEGRKGVSFGVGLSFL